MWHKIYIAVNVLYIMLFVSANDERTTVKTELVETTTELITIITDIPQSDIEKALNQDYGTYTTESFGYFNSQYDKLLQNDRCFDDYTKCLITQAVAHPVCVVNDPWEKKDGYATYNSYCDAYFDNCQRKMRFWRILDNGKCTFGYNNYFDISNTRKYYKNLPYFLKKLVSSVFK